MITVTSLAAEKIKGIKAAQAAPAEVGLRIRVVGGGCSGFQSGTELDYVDGLTGAGFTLKNPNAKGSCGCGSSFTA